MKTLSILALLLTAVIACPALSESFGPPMAFFDAGSSELDPATGDKLVRDTRATIERLQSYGLRVTSIVISGHAGGQDPDSKAMELAFRRADVARKRLADAGLLTVRSHLEVFERSRPMVSEGEGDDRLNRRIEVDVNFQQPRSMR